GQDNTSVDAGLYKPAAIGDFVWEDLNGNGLQDAGEPGINGITVDLLNSLSVIVATTTTTTVGGVDGRYEFTGLAPGTYKVQFVAAGYTSQDAGNDNIDSDANIAGQTGAYTLSSGDVNLTVDAGLFRPAAIGDFVWNDLNANGVQDAGEPGILNATVKLYRSNTLVGTTLTNASGFYSFTGLMPGSYSVTFTAPALSGYLL